MARNNRIFSPRYIALIGVGSFLLTVAFSVLAEALTHGLRSIVFAFFFLLMVVAINVLADVLGTASTAASESSFHARAAQKIPGAYQGFLLVRNADKVANIANDVIGDIAATLSGAMGISLVFQVVRLWPHVDRSLLAVLATAGIAALTVAGKAAGKQLAVARADEVVFLAGRVLAYWERLTGRRVPRRRRGRG
ncbi:MAG: hypothetical protein H5T97_13400 [Firmicutes bacterium]|nr:hypothetical protein [Bacillota bacterium]